MRVEVHLHLRSGHLFWSAENRLASELIDVQALFHDYWSSNRHELTVQSKSSSPTSPLVSDHGAQKTLLLLGSIVGL